MFSDNRLTDGGENVSFMLLAAALYPQEDSWYSFLLEDESTSHSGAGRITTETCSNITIC
jgi:hypothetical protein